MDILTDFFKQAITQCFDSSKWAGNQIDTVNRTIYFLDVLEYISKFNKNQIRNTETIVEYLIKFSHANTNNKRAVTYLLWLLYTYYPKSTYLDNALSKAIENENYEDAEIIVNLQKMEVPKQMPLRIW